MTQSSVVIDASVVLEWIEKKESKNKLAALEILERIKMGEIVTFAPRFLMVEVANIVFWKKKLSDSETQEFLRFVEDLGIIFDNKEYPQFIDDIFNLMRKYKITAYDAQYVFLALKLRAKLATFDERLIQIKEINLGRFA